MTLAAIFVIIIFYTSPPATAATHQSAAPSAPATQTSDSAPAQNPPAQNPPTPSQTAPAATTPAKTSAGKSSTTPANRPRHKKKVLPPDCNNVPAASGKTAPPSPPDPATGTAPASSPAVAKCPPPKVIVRQGGTTEPSIQLVGGTGSDQTAHQRDSANEMLAETQANLKKTGGQQLTANQQDMVNQIQQFMDQSKTAAEAGDLERAQNLALKAKLLSDELVKPEK